MNEKKDYAFRTMLNVPYEQALEKVKASLRDEGFGVLTSVDVKETMKEKLGVDFRPYTIIGACNPPLSHRAFEQDLEAGLVLPCNVIVYEKDGGSAVAIADPVTMIGVLENPDLGEVAHEAQAKLKRVIVRLERRTPV